MSAEHVFCYDFNGKKSTTANRSIVLSTFAIAGGHCTVNTAGTATQLTEDDIDDTFKICIDPYFSGVGKFLGFTPNALSKFPDFEKQKIDCIKKKHWCVFYIKLRDGYIAVDPKFCDIQEL